MSAHIPFARLRRAVADPGKVTARRGRDADAMETVAGWQTRAVVQVIREWLDGREVVDLPEPSGVADNGDVWWEYPGGRAWSRANGRFDADRQVMFRRQAAAMLAAVEHNERRAAEIKNEVA